jgi:hypothetical protein
MAPGYRAPDPNDLGVAVVGLAVEFHQLGFEVSQTDGMMSSMRFRCRSAKTS